MPYRTCATLEVRHHSFDCSSLSSRTEIRNQKSDCDWNEPVYPGRYCSFTHSPNYVCSPHWRGMPCPAHRYDTLLSACIYIGAIEPSARVPDTNLSLPYTPSRSASLPLRSSHTLAYNYLHRPWLRCVRQHHHPHRPPSPCRFVGGGSCRPTVSLHR